MGDGRSHRPDPGAGLDRLADQCGVGLQAHHVPQDPRLTLGAHPETPGPTDDLRHLPQVQRAPPLAVVLRRLGHHHRAGGQVDAVTDHVGDAEDVQLAGRRSARSALRRAAGGRAP